MDRAWALNARFDLHAKYGTAMTEVSPYSVKLFIADRDSLVDASMRQNEFIKPAFVYGPLEILGPNLDTVNGQTWTRHHKITAPPFNEKNSALVWQEAINQATAMLATWQHQEVVGTNQEDLHALALNVLCVAGFGVKSDYVENRNSVDGDTRGGRLGYTKALQLVLGSFISLNIIHGLDKAGWSKSWLSGSLRRIADARDEFTSYMEEMIDRERVHHEQGNLDRHNLISSLIRADVRAKKDDKANPKNTPGAAGKGLSTEEIHGNLFMFNLAGHETTASSLTYATILLALHPEFQPWLSHEINNHRANNSSGQYFYEETFPHLPRCLALMYETLRFYGPVPMSPREVEPSSRTDIPLLINGRTHYIPTGVLILMNFVAFQCDPAAWGNDALVFNPKRFMATDDTTGKEAFRDPTMPNSSFTAWNVGTRTCPGKKFSQVEFVAVVSTLFAGSTRVRLARKGGESQEQVVANAERAMAASTTEVAMRMREEVELEWYSEE